MPKIHTGVPGHLAAYPPSTLDNTTLRHLRDDSEKWLIDTQAMREAFRALGPAPVEEWDGQFIAEVQDEAEALAVIDAELAKRAPRRSFDEMLYTAAKDAGWAA